MDQMLYFLKTLKESKQPLIYRYEEKTGEKRTEQLLVNYDMVGCLLCLLYVFGRRLSGVLMLRRGDLWIKKGYLYVRFTVLKKSKRVEKPKPKKRVKRVSVEKQWKYVQHILNYVAKMKTPDQPLFPGRSRSHTRKIIQRDKDGRIHKIYKYDTKIQGIMSRQRAYKLIKAINPNIYPHWFRHSLATQLAEEGIDPWQLMNWFDWDRFATAKRYVSGTAAMTRDISNREVG